MITVAECSSADEALVLQSLLAGCGLAAHLPDDLKVTYRGTGPSFRVQVADEDAETARAVLDNRAP
jgi:hypothetical protein